MLLSGEWSTDKFLDWSANIFRNFHATTNGADEEDANEDEEESETNEGVLLNPDNLCIICADQPRNMILFPCFHLQTCNVCIEQLIIASGPEGFNCPTPNCHVHVINTGRPLF